jgi:hypothetical protein
MDEVHLFQARAKSANRAPIVLTASYPDSLEVAIFLFFYERGQSLKRKPGSKKEEFQLSLNVPYWYNWLKSIAEAHITCVTGRLGLGAGSRELVTRRGTAQEWGLEIRSVGRG